MSSFEYLDMFDMIITGFMILILLILLGVDLRKMKTADVNSPPKHGSKLTIFGVGAMICSIVLLFLIEKNIDETALEFFRPISGMTSRPFVVLALALLSLGVVTIISGISRIKLLKKLENGEGN